jgi:hypothetical protein
MAFRKIYDGIRLIAKAVSSGSTLGSIQALDANSDGIGTVQIHNGTSYSDVVTASHAATLTNKSIDGFNNTVTNLANSAIETNAGIEITKLETIPNGHIITSDGITNTTEAPDWSNGDINANAEIGLSKLESAVPGYIPVANGANRFTAVEMTGKVIISNAGVTAFNPSELIVDADIAVGADITRDKLLAGTSDVILANDGFGRCSESTITVAELEAAVGGTAITTVTLTDNTTTVAHQTTVSDKDVIHIKYSIKRGVTYEAGTITVISDGTNASIAQGGVCNIGDTGVTFTAAISGALLQVRGTATNTGTNATFKYSVSDWEA